MRNWKRLTTFSGIYLSSYCITIANKSMRKSNEDKLLQVKFASRLFNDVLMLVIAIFTHYVTFTKDEMKKGYVT